MNSATDLPAAPGITTPSPPCVSHDLPCAGCGYNLRTLAVTAVCPECAHPIEASMRFRHLHLADVRWLRALRRGTILMGVAVAAMVMLLVSSFGLLPVAYSPFVLLGLITVLVLPWTAGVWLGTTSEPDAPAANRRSGFRWLNRFVALACIQCVGMTTAAWLLSLNVLNWIGLFLYFEMFALLFLSPMLVCLYFRDIDRRAGRPGLRRINGFLAAFTGLGLVLVLVAAGAPLGFSIIPYEVMYLAVFGIGGLSSVLGVAGLVGHYRLFTRAMAGRPS